MVRKVFILIIATLSFAAMSCTRVPVRTTDSPPVAGTGVIEMSPAEARPKVEAAYSQFIDVRTKEEYDGGHAYRARNIPLDELPASLDRLEKSEPVYLICHSGSRSKKAAQILTDAGFPQAISISGGTAQWEAEGLPMAPK